MNAGPGTLQPRAWRSYPLGSRPPLVLRLLGGVLLPPSLLLEPGQQRDELGEWVSPLLEP